MEAKKDSIIEQAKAVVREPASVKLIETESSKKGYRIVAMSLYTPEAEWVDHITRGLQQAGNPKANRSFVIREAILRLQEELKDKSPDEVLQNFIRRHAERVQRG